MEFIDKPIRCGFELMPLRDLARMVIDAVLDRPRLYGSSVMGEQKFGVVGFCPISLDRCCHNIRDGSPSTRVTLTYNSKELVGLEQMVFGQ